MQTLRLIVSPSGRLAPQPFVVGAVLIYLAGIASQWLTKPDVIAHGGLWLFAAAQALVIWSWFALHAKRLRDAGRSAGLAVGVSLLYAFSVALLIILAASFFNGSAAGLPDASAASALGLILLVSIVSNLLGSTNYDLAWLLASVLTLIAFVPPIAAVATTLWAATRPRTV